MAKGFRNYINNTVQRMISSEGITHPVYATFMELYYGKAVHKTVENSYEELSQVRFKPSGVCYTSDRQYAKQPRYDLDIIIPVYNVESYGSYDGITDKLFDIIHHKGAFYYGN